MQPAVRAERTQPKSKLKTGHIIAAAFRLAANTTTAADEAPQPKKERKRSGGNEGRAIIVRRTPKLLQAARGAGRYAGLRGNIATERQGAQITANFLETGAAMFQGLRTVMDNAFGVKMRKSFRQAAAAHQAKPFYMWRELEAEGVSFDNPFGGMFDGDTSFDLDDYFDTSPDYSYDAF